MRDWLAYWDQEWKLSLSRVDIEPPAVDIVSRVQFPEEKPPAMVSLDDRCLLFSGVWPSMETLLEFKPWNK